MVQLTVSEAEHQGSVVRILRSLLFVFFVVISLLLFLLFVSIPFHFFSLCILIMIFPLLVSGVLVGRLCWVVPAVLAAEGDGGCLELFVASLLTGWQSSSHNMCGFKRSCSSAGVLAFGRWVAFDAGTFYQFG